MAAFARALKDLNPDPTGRRWLYVPYDQLSDKIGPLSRWPADETGIVVVENRWKAARRPYHKQKLALVLANMRHFALEQARRGVAVRFVAGAAPYRELLAPIIDELGTMTMMRPAERELRMDLAPLVASGRLEEIEHEGWLTDRQTFEQAMKGKLPWRMDAFYRAVRQQTGLLMEDGKPLGGKYSHDADNRQPWSGQPKAAEPPVFEPDEVTQEVGDLIRRAFEVHPGQLDLTMLPATAADAERLWSWARQDCLPRFGPYEDAMSVRSTTIFHTRVSPLVNLHRLLPSRLVADAAKAKLPLSSQEGFIRQVIGWREFMHHVHEQTDGFRRLPAAPDVTHTRAEPGDGGYESWSGIRWEPPESPELDGGAAPSFLGDDRPVPTAFWGQASGLACLDRVVADVWREAYSHHITRLMVLGNLGTLLGLSPRDLADWFWCAYADAYDWVVEPNVMGMAMFGLGPLFVTKPYVSGAAYIDKMSDYCGDCRFHPKKTCPVTPMYWAFLGRHEPKLADNPRMKLILASLRKRGDAQRAVDARVYGAVVESLSAGKPLSATIVKDAQKQ
ncbi:MAG: cryptochrome/photolyase family protein [Myxococcota bacterium]